MLFFFSYSLTSLAEVNPDSNAKPMIYAIRIVGNRTTSSELILREMLIKPGMTASMQDLDRDRLRLESTGLFNRVEMEVVADEGRAVLIVRVSEPFYIFPFWILFWDPRSPDKNVYGGGIYHVNIRGLGERLGVLAWNGYERGISLVHQDPWFSIGGKYGVEASVSYSDRDVAVSGMGDIRREAIGLSAGIVKRLGHRQSIQFDGIWYNYSSEYRPYTISQGWRDRIAGVRITSKYDLRDYRYYPTTGSYYWSRVEIDRLIDLPQNYYREWIDIRVYKKVSQVIFAGRGYGEFAQATLPHYHWLELSPSILRAGDPDPRPKGAILATSGEMRFTLLRKRYYSFSQIPFAGPYLMNLKFSLEGLIFLDGAMSLTGRSGITDRFGAYGFGVQFQVPYINTIHLISGWSTSDNLNSPTVTLGTGVTF